MSDALTGRSLKEVWAAQEIDVLTIPFPLFSPKERMNFTFIARYVKIYYLPRIYLSFIFELII